jgi:predicted RNA-binding protein YlqC (UPF0109 family)
VSSFDDEFGLFGDDVPAEEEERRPTLGARRIASRETVIDEIEPEDDPGPRRRFGPRGGSPSGTAPTLPPRRRRADAPSRPPLAPEIAHPRAVGLLDDRGAVLELKVDPDDLGKVIGRAGRVAQALRTLVRAGAEGRVTIDILDVDEEYEDDDEEQSDAPNVEGAEESSPD